VALAISMDLCHLSLTGGSHTHR